MRILILAITLFSTAAFSTAVAAEPEKFTAMDIFQLQYASNPQVSPDGSFVVYSHNFMDVMADKRRSNLWRVDTNNGSARPITTGAVNDGGAAISPDSSRLAYLSADDKGAQIFVRWFEGGETQQLTRLPLAPSNLVWSADGQWLAFNMFVPQKPPTMGEMPPAPKGAEWAEPATVIDRSQFRADGAGELPTGYTHVFVIPAAAGVARQLTSGDFNHAGSIAWADDSESLFITANRSENAEMDPANSEIYRISMDGSELTQITFRQGPDNGVALSPSGNQLAWTGYDDARLSYQLNRLYVADIDGKNRRVMLPELDRSIAAFEWASYGKGLFVQYDDQGKTLLVYVSLKGKVTQMSDQLSGLSLSRPYTGGSFSVGGKNTYAYTSADANSLADIAVGRGTGKAKAKLLTDMNSSLLAHRSMATVEELWVKSSHDERDIQAWVARPADFDPARKYPLLLEIHGGPHAAYGPHFAAEIQLFTAAGYVVVYANPRGSTSYGEQFAQTIHHNYPSEDYDDLMTVVDGVIAQGSIDESQLYVTGGSGGGVLTAWIVGKTDRFRAAVVAKPVINWISFVLSADLPAIFSQYWFAKMPWEEGSEHWERSPLSLVGNVTTPTMLLVGQSDYRTPSWESEQYYQALKLQGVATALVRIPGASHSIAKRPSQLMAKVAAILEWFERHSGREKDDS
jgi:dipeptidyl aminopeptidase/acylaminoacyl peptidase